ncbi:MAG: ABC transporter permease subunit [Alphaproteobacteria bacterium]|nr:ABC transporter permease subunit [Alphaproteobacteria bacterium]
MLTFLARRLLGTVIVLAVMSFVIFLLIGLMPGDPIDIMIASNPDLTTADGERLKRLHGLDLPITERYWNWLTAALGGDLGYSRTFNRPVLDILLPRLGNTIILLGIASLTAIAIALPLGFAAAVNPHSLTDNGINMFCFAGISVPAFWLAILLILLFAVTLGVLPAGGMGPVGGGGGFFDRLEFLVLPVLTLTIASLAGYTRFARASMMEAMRQDYVRTAYAKGLSVRNVVVGHAMRNALLPLVTVVALDFGALFSGALITETMFGYLGMGKLMFDSILANDFNLALVGLLFATLLVLVGNFLADIAYAAIDPRISFKSLADQ